MSYVITGRDLQALRRCVNDLAGLVNGRNDVPAQFHTDVDAGRAALEGAVEEAPSAPAPVTTVKAAAAAIPDEEEKS